MKIFKFSSLMLATVVLLAACGNKAGKSETTGWNYNDPQWGGYDVSDRTNQQTAPGLVFIEGGSFTMGHVGEDTRYTWDNVAHTVTVSSFYLDECEISNKQYGEFVYWMKRAYSDEFPEKVQKIMPDTAIWRDRLAWRESFVDHYFQSPSYFDYPVVGVSWEQAREFCRWRTDRVNEKLLVDMGIINLDQENLGTGAFQTDVYLAGRYEGERRQGLKDLNPSNGGEDRDVRKSDGILYPYYRLPTEAEWEFAALGAIGTTYDERVTEHKVYPWAGHSLRSANKKYYGQFLANFKRTRGDAMGVAGNLNDGWDYTCPVKWYFPNDYGLYNMAGNVSEWCADVYRKSNSGYEDVDAFRGNIYETPDLDEDGAPMIGDDGMMVYKEVEDQMNRRNYRQADNVNYLDGDKNSQLDMTSWESNSSERSSDDGDEEATESESDEESYEGDEESESSNENTALSEGDKWTNQMYRRKADANQQVTSLVNNKVRVVKGGSWKDRAYYLQPATRRYLDQDKSASWIGFRCAMDRLGSRVQ